MASEAATALIAAAASLVLDGSAADKARIVFADALPGIAADETRQGAIAVSAGRWLAARDTDDRRRIEADLRWQVRDYFLHRMGDAHARLRPQD